MKKVALILHGWPQPITKDSLYYHYFEKRNYKIYAPYFLDADFPCTLAGIEEEIKTNMGEDSPQVILGFSLGGLILPHIAKLYPESKLVFIATGSYLRPSSNWLGKLLNFAQKGGTLENLRKILSLFPPKLYYMFYSLAFPFSGSPEDFPFYQNDMRLNLRCLCKISGEKEKQAFKLIKSIDNTQIIKDIKNKTLIFSGKNDPLMPLSLGKQLKELLSNSELIITNGAHYNVFTEENLKNLDEFLNS